MMCLCPPGSGGFSLGMGPGDEFVDDLEEYKERLELEIRHLEKRIAKLREEASAG
ncbi:MAG: hypothetical protein LN413_03030 [Candidatus Thermoplasmatota archaeon]|nr:hypothetical protein [Candidatus Thermoplasmatota archaeon]